MKDLAKTLFATEDREILLIYSTQGSSKPGKFFVSYFWTGRI